MGFINDILDRLSADRQEERVRYRTEVTHNVIDEMIAKYGEVDTSIKDIDVIHQEIRKVREDMNCHIKLKPSGQSRCKKAEDDHNDRLNELEVELKVLHELYRKVVTIELNKFPLNKPCTINYVTDYIGVKDEKIVWNILTSGDVNNVAPSLCYYGSKRYDMCVTDLSESEVRILVERTDGYRHRHKYYYEHRDYHEQYNIHTMILSNWRFVKSMDSSIFYVERFKL